MKSLTIAGLALAFAGASTIASADLRIDVVGVPGSGSTIWTFSGTPDTVTTAGSIRTNAANTFNAGDSGQFPFGQNTILDTTIQDQVLTFTGAATVTIGNDTQTITGIYLDDDGASADDLGIRVATQLDYAVGESSSWTGAGTLAIDITKFSPGTWSINSTQGQAMFFGDPIIVTFNAVPEPATLGALAIGCGVLGWRRRRRQ